MRMSPSTRRSLGFDAKSTAWRALIACARSSRASDDGGVIATPAADLVGDRNKVRATGASSSGELIVASTSLRGFLT